MNRWIAILGFVVFFAVALFFVAALLCARFGTLSFAPLLGAAALSIGSVIRAPRGLRRPLLDEGVASSERPRE